MATKKVTTKKAPSKARVVKKAETTKEVTSGDEGRSLRERVSRTNLKFILPLVALFIGIVVVGYLAYKGLVVGWVDRTPVTRMELYNQLNDRYGKEILDQIISEKLILSEARRQKVTASNEEIDAQIAKIEEEQGGKEQLDQILSFQNMTRDKLREQIKLQVMIEKMFGKDVTVTEQEIKDYKDNNPEQPGEAAASTASESARLNAQIADILKRQKIGKSFNEWLTGALTGPRIVRL